MLRRMTICRTRDQIESQAAKTDGTITLTDFGPATALLSDDLLPQDFPTIANVTDRESDLPAFERLESARGRNYRRAPVMLVGVTIATPQAENRYTVGLLAD